MKSICTFCYQSYNEDNLYRCSQCNSEYCYETRCHKEHEIKCAHLAERYHSLTVNAGGSFTIDIEPVSWFEELMAGAAYHCPNCAHTLSVRRPERISWLKLRKGYYWLKRVFYKMRYDINFEQATLREFCESCNALLEIYRWQGMVTVTVTPRRRCPIAARFAMSGRRPRMPVQIPFV